MKRRFEICSSRSSVVLPFGKTLVVLLAQVMSDNQLQYDKYDQ